MRTHNFQALMFLGTAILVALLFLRDRHAPPLDPSAREADALVLRHPLRVPLRVGSPSIDAIASVTRPVLGADDSDGAQGAPTGRAMPQLAPNYRPLSEGWCSDQSNSISGTPQGPAIRRLIPAPTWSPVPHRVREHCVVPGDTLRQLAERYLGDDERWLELYSHNRRVLASPEFLPIGTVLEIPPRNLPRPKGPNVDHWQVDLVPLKTH